MQEEYDYLVVNNIWFLVSLPKGKKPISCKWMFKTKHGVDDVLEIIFKKNMKWKI